MAGLVIDDLEEDRELDDIALRAVTGGKAGVSSNQSVLKHFPKKLPMEESKLIPGLLKSPAFTLS